MSSIKQSDIDAATPTAAEHEEVLRAVEVFKRQKLTPQILETLKNVLVEKSPEVEKALKQHNKAEKKREQVVLDNMPAVLAYIDKNKAKFINPDAIVDDLGEEMTTKVPNASSQAMAEVACSMLGTMTGLQNELQVAQAQIAEFQKVPVQAPPPFSAVEERHSSMQRLDKVGQEMRDVFSNYKNTNAQLQTPNTDRLAELNKLAQSRKE